MLNSSEHEFSNAHKYKIYQEVLLFMGWLGGAMVLGKLPVPGHPTNLNKSRAGAYCACRGCGLFGHFYSRLSFLSSFSLSGRRPDID